ncbi:TPA: transcriptional regulator PhoB, partial [Escherichia coli]|nr:transcriptional regulator PhoB [Escherichia coli]
ENALLTVSGFTDFGVSQGKATKEKVIEQERVSAAPFCEKLNIPGNSEVFHLCRVMYLDKEPLFIDSSWIPLSRYPDFDEIYVEGSSTYQLFQERFDTRVVSDKKTIDIFAATRPQAKWLKCELGEPLFRISKIAFDQNDKPVHVSELFCRANRITLTIDNKRH